MALAFANTLVQTVTAQTINAGVTYVDAEIHIGVNTLAEQVAAYLEVDGWAAAPAGNELMHVIMRPIHTTAGDAFDDNVIELLATVTADQQYQFSWVLDRLTRYSKMAVKNDTGQNTDANAVDAWLEFVKVTA